jgi:hypothetical protein
MFPTRYAKGKLLKGLLVHDCVNFLDGACCPYHRERAKVPSIYYKE